MSYYDGILQYPRYHKANKGVKGTIKLISPNQYFVEAGKNRRVPITSFQEQTGVSMMYVDSYLKRAQIEKMPIPVIDKVNHEQEGRHRAMVAKQLGLKKIPVLFVEKT